jgi:hypothetical protein
MNKSNPVESPTTKPFLTAQWRYLAMLNYSVDPAVLTPYLPAGVELDEWNGKTYASLVGFLFLDTSLLGVPILSPGFREVNLRFYVRRAERRAGGEGRVREGNVPRWAIAAIAQVTCGERYIALKCNTDSKPRKRMPSRVSVEYAWRFGGKWNRLWALAEGEPQPLEGSTEEEFITEHYWGYARRRDGRTVEYQVEHPRWRVWQVGECGVELEAGALYGPTFTGLVAAQPSSAFIAEGSPVTVYRGSLI